MAFQEEVLTLPTATNDRRHEDIFYTGMASAILLTILTGFGASYYWRAAPFSALVYLHAGVFTGWVLLFFARRYLWRRVIPGCIVAWVLLGGGWRG